MSVLECSLWLPDQMEIAVRSGDLVGCPDTVYIIASRRVGVLHGNKGLEFKGIPESLEMRALVV